MDRYVSGEVRVRKDRSVNTSSQLAGTGMSNTENGVTVRAYRGDEAVLLAFNLDDTLTEHLAGFAIECTPPTGQSFYLPNRLSFSTPATNTSTTASRQLFSSNEAPIQKFRWLHIPSAITPGTYTYQVTPLYFAANTTLTPGPSVSVSLDFMPAPPLWEHFELGFTRGFVSSQTYVERFGNAPISPSHQTFDFDTSSYQAQYQWLGFHARTMIVSLMEECLADPACTVDVFAFDLDEPDFIRALEQLGPRLRIVLDNSTEHTAAGKPEVGARAALQQSAGADHVVNGHFQRFAHDKVIIQKRSGTPTKVLTGSANFSVRGLYVQANNVLIYDDPQVAALYEQTFEQAFTDMSHFARGKLASQWFDLTSPGIPATSVSFAPHSSADLSLGRVAQAIEQAQSSVLFAVMELQGGGQVLSDLVHLGERQNIFGYGVTQSAQGLNVYPPGAANGILTPFSFLSSQVPAPFQKEWRGGSGEVIHDKFVVVDFNTAHPTVFTGSSNLSSGGEEANGDNLLAIGDPAVASIFAVEAVRLVDHFHFRAVLQNATQTSPLVLQPDADRWWGPYYDSSTIKYRDRLLFAG